MNKAELLFEYTHFRFYQFFKKYGDSISEFSATLVLTIAQCLTLLDLVVIVRMFYEFPLPEKIYVLPVIIICGIVNWYRYERNFDPKNLENRWGGEGKEQQIRNGWFIGLYLVVLLLIPMLYGYLKHNLKAI